MITKTLGNVHGVFYADGTVRDPSIPAAMLGLFRNRGDNALAENVNRENWVDSDVGFAQQWLANPAGTWKDGLGYTERLANLLEASQMISMAASRPRATVDLVAPARPNQKSCASSCRITSTCLSRPCTDSSQPPAYAPERSPWCSHAAAPTR